MNRFERGLRHVSEKLHRTSLIGYDEADAALEPGNYLIFEAGTRTSVFISEDYDVKRLDSITLKHPHEVHTEIINIVEKSSGRFRLDSVLLRSLDIPNARDRRVMEKEQLIRTFIKNEGLQPLLASKGIQADHITHISLQNRIALPGRYFNILRTSELREGMPVALQEEEQSSPNLPSNVVYLDEYRARKKRMNPNTGER